MYERYTKRARPAIIGVLMVLAAAGLTATSVAPAQAVPDPGPPPALGDTLASQVTVNAFPLIGSAAGAQDPTNDPTLGYPAFPGALTPGNVTTAQIQLKDTFGSALGLAYCVDLSTETRVGTNYDAGDWTQTTVPNLDYVAYILGAYFPNTSAPTGLSSTDKTAAVQAAIWFFTDHFILTDTSPLRSATGAIVADALANAPGSQPAIPELSVTPASGGVPTNGDLVGPFTINGNVTTAVVEQLGVQLYRDAAGTQPIASGDTVAVGSSVWAAYVSTTVPQGFRVSAVVAHLQGSVYLYNGTNPGLGAAQKVILASTALLPARAGVPLTPYSAGSLAITKAVSGTAAGLQGDVTVRVDCSSSIGDVTRTVTLAAGATAGSHPLPVLSDLPDGAICTITEPGTGENASVVRSAVDISPPTVTIAQGTVVTVLVSNTYDPAPITDLAATGAAIDGALITAGAALIVGALLLAVRSIRRRPGRG